MWPWDPDKDIPPGAGLPPRGLAARWTLRSPPPPPRSRVGPAGLRRCAGNAEVRSLPGPGMPGSVELQAGAGFPRQSAPFALCRKTKPSSKEPTFPSHFYYFLTLDNTTTPNHPYLSARLPAVLLRGSATPHLGNGEQTLFGTPGRTRWVEPGGCMGLANGEGADSQTNGVQVGGRGPVIQSSSGWVWF